MKTYQRLRSIRKLDGDDKIIDYIENNRHLLSGRPQCYQHGDYHVGNMIISPEHTLSIKVAVKESQNFTNDFLT